MALRYSFAHANLLEQQQQSNYERRNFTVSGPVSRNQGSSQELWLRRLYFHLRPQLRSGQQRSVKGARLGFKVQITTTRLFFSYKSRPRNVSGGTTLNLTHSLTHLPLQLREPQNELSLVLGSH